MAKGKVKLAGLKQTHGALTAPLSIEELTGQTQKYAAATLEAYQEILASMSDEDMREHAIEVGEVPIDTRSLLIDRLERRFVNVAKRSVIQVPKTKVSKEAEEFQRRFLQGNG